MYSIKWVNSHKMNLLIGDKQSIFAVANMLEDKKEHFAVADVGGFKVSEQMLGFGGFKYWLKPGEGFPNS